jgi:hypothetical protein
MHAKIRVNMSMATGQVRSCHDTYYSMTYSYLGLQFRLNIIMSIAGLPTEHSTATTVTNAACPIELPANAG